MPPTETEQPTLSDDRASRGRVPEPPASAGQLAGMRGSSVVARSAAYELRREEAARARAFSASVAVVCGVAALGELVAASDAASVRVVMVASCAAAAAVAAEAWMRTADPLRYTRWVARRLALASLVAATLLTWRIGVFSPAPMLTTLGVAFFGLGEDRRAAYGFAGASCAAYAIVAWSVASGTMVDVGLVQAQATSPGGSLAMVLLVPIVHVATLWHARLGRRATLDAIERSNSYFREARQREAQLEEANRDLDMLLKMAPGESAPYTGERAGMYLLHERIGRGAMGEVYSAKHVESGQMAAVKLLQPSMQENAVLMERFHREGDAASKLRAPNVVQIYELGSMADGAPYIAMELLRGHDLGWHLRRRGQLTMDEVLSLVEQVAAGLEAARVAGIVHRDLKPQNLFLAQQLNAAPMWKILDFGVSRLADSGGTLTKDIIVGTPGYMSPEQAAGTQVTHKSDVFAFGAVIYRALTGAPAFAGEDTPQTLYQVVYRNPPRPSALMPGIPPDVDLVLATAMAKDPADRFESARELANAMHAAARSSLDARLRLSARTLLAALPWGTDMRGSAGDVGDEISLSEAESIEVR
jgi:serine/threonine-protein kinase